MTDTTTAASELGQPLGLPLNNQLGLAPAYLGNGHQAYAARVVAAWPEHNRVRFGTLLFTGVQLEAAFEAGRLAERNQCRYPQCTENQDERCPRWLTGDCAGPNVELTGARRASGPMQG